MKFRFNFPVILLLCFSINLFNTAYAGAGRIQGKVTETMNAAGYTYVEVDTGKNKVWAAAPITEIKVGDQVEFSTVMPMKNFQSKALNRQFSVVYFAQNFITDKKSSTAKINKNASPNKSKQASAVIIKKMAKAKDGHSIADIYANKNELANKIIRVRGQVTKFTPNILKKNWLHIKDNSSADDLTITTDSTAAVNDVIVISGKLGLNRDFGYGYLYPLIIEDAKISK